MVALFNLKQKYIRITNLRTATHMQFFIPCVSVSCFLLIMDKYIIIKELPDAHVGTEVNWDENTNAFWYEKWCFVSPHQKNYLTAGQVTQTPEYFCKANEYPEYFAYKYPVYNREEILNLIKECFPNKRMSGQFEISASKEIHQFESKLRELGKNNAETLIRRRS